MFAVRCRNLFIQKSPNCNKVSRNMDGQAMGRWLSRLQVDEHCANVSRDHQSPIQVKDGYGVMILEIGFAAEGGCRSAEEFG